ncbi:hypothetical protein HDU97_007326 [Phlyctochytrium planicorne]|nr:hypothetical protein HDU97_007326 [Phlyctochytrium planicorne]
MTVNGHTYKHVYVFKLDFTGKHTEAELIRACWAYHTFSSKAGGKGKLLEKFKDPKRAQKHRQESCPSGVAVDIMKGFKGYSDEKSAKRRFGYHCASIKKDPGYQTLECDEFPPASSNDLSNPGQRHASSMCLPGRSNGSAGQLVQKLPEGALFTFTTDHSEHQLLDYCHKWVELQAKHTKREHELPALKKNEADGHGHTGASTPSSRRPGHPERKRKRTDRFKPY